MVGIVLLEHLEHEILEEEAVRRIRKAVPVAAGGVTPCDQLERDHVHAPRPEGNRVYLRHEVSRDILLPEQPEDVAGGLRRGSAFALEQVALVAVSGGDVVLVAGALRYDHSR